MEDLAVTSRSAARAACQRRDERDAAAREPIAGEGGSHLANTVYLPRKFADMFQINIYSKS